MADGTEPPRPYDASDNQSPGSHLKEAKKQVDIAVEKLDDLDIDVVSISDDVDVEFEPEHVVIRTAYSDQTVLDREIALLVAFAIENQVRDAA